MILVSDVVQKRSQSSQVHRRHAKQTLIGSDIRRYIRQLFPLFGVIKKLQYIIVFRLGESCVASILFTFKHSLISYFATHNQQTTNYRVDIPRVLQRFSINCKQFSQNRVLCLLVHVYISMHKCILSGPVSALAQAHTHTCPPK